MLRKAELRQDVQMGSLPPDLQRLLDEIDAADRAGAAIAAETNDRQFYWHPRDGRGWSIAQCLDHLGIINAFYGAAIRRGIDRARARGWKRAAPAAPGFLGAWFVKSQEPPVKRRLRAPDQVQPQLSKDRDEILRAYHAAHDGIRQMIADAADVDVNRAAFPNPFVRVIRMRVSTGLAVLPAHDRRHLWQAEQVRKERGYPP
jgi:hypothetical protein